MTLNPVLRRGVLVFLAAFAIIVVSHVLRGASLNSTLAESAAWAVVSTVVFSVWDWRRLRRGEHCAVCDGPVAPKARR